jgi:Mg-chelatase subunit ChlD
MSKKRLYAHILLDRSGSMEECRDSTISAFNEYVNTLRADDAVSARVSLTLFDDQSIDLVFDKERAGEMPKLTKETFVPRGMTPLNDAIGKTAATIDKENLLDGENVAFVILTDGLENASKEYSPHAVKKLLDRVQKEKNWLVIYLGANQDAFAEGGARGTVVGSTMDFDVAEMLPAVRAAASSSVRYAKSARPADAAFTTAERASARSK